MMNQIARLLAPLRRRVDNMVARAVLRLVYDDAALQALQIEVLRGEIRDQVERFQEYGLTSHPHPGAEAVVVFASGDRSHGLVVAVDDRRYRPQGLEQGEVALYTDEGDYILLKRGRVIEVVAGAKLDVTAPEVVVAASTSVTLDTPTVTCTGVLNVPNGLVTAGAGLTVTGPLTNNGKNVGSTHSHSGVQPGSGNSGPPV